MCKKVGGCVVFVQKVWFCVQKKEFCVQKKGVCVFERVCVCVCVCVRKGVCG